MQVGVILVGTRIAGPTDRHGPGQQQQHNRNDFPDPHAGHLA
jgi:hypothetical protein